MPWYSGWVECTLSELGHIHMPRWDDVICIKAVLFFELELEMAMDLVRVICPSALGSLVFVSISILYRPEVLYMTQVYCCDFFWGACEVILVCEVLYTTQVYCWDFCGSL